MLSRRLGTETRLHWKCSLVSCISGVPCSSTGLWGHWILPGVSLLWWHGAGSWQLPALLCSALPAPAHPMLVWGLLGMGFLPPHHLPATAHSQPGPKCMAEPANFATTPADRGSAFPLLFLHVHPAEMQAQGAAHTARVKPGAGSWCSHPFPCPSSAPPAVRRNRGQPMLEIRVSARPPTSPTSPGGCRGSDCSLLASAFSTGSCPGCRAGDRTSLTPSPVPKGADARVPQAAPCPQQGEEDSGSTPETSPRLSSGQRGGKRLS